MRQGVQNSGRRPVRRFRGWITTHIYAERGRKLQSL